MGTVHRVVICTDFAAGSDAAIERGVRLAQDHHAALDLLHAFDSGVLGRLGTVFDARRLSGDVPPDVRLREQLTLAAKRLAERSGLEVQPRFGVGEPAVALESHVRMHHPAVAVLAHRADPGAPGVGSTLMRVLRGVGCPILVVRARADTAAPCAAYQRVLCAMDLREVATRAAATALGLFPHAEHRLVTVVDPRWERALWPQGEAPAEAPRPSLRGEATRRLQALAAQLPRSANTRLAAAVHNGVPARVLVEQAAVWPADCIVAFVAGGVLLFDRGIPGFGVPLPLIFGLALTSAATVALGGGMALRRPVVSGREELRGAEGVVLATDSAGKGEGSGRWALVHGERWRVVGTEPLAPGQRVRVTGRWPATAARQSSSRCPRRCWTASPARPTRAGTRPRRVQAPRPDGRRAAARGAGHGDRQPAGQPVLTRRDPDGGRYVATSAARRSPTPGRRGSSASPPACGSRSLVRPTRHCA